MTTSLPSTNPVDDYARRVVAGDVPAGKYHRLACVRHLGDRDRENTSGFPYRFVWEERDGKDRLRHCAMRFLKFARQVKHYKGKKWAGQFFEPSEAQVFRLGSIFGWRNVVTGYRRFTTAYNEIPRKNGKSFEAAIVLVYCTFFEGEPGADGFVIATKEKQAKIVFGDAKRMVSRSPSLRARIAVAANNLHRDSTASKAEPLGSDSDTTDGLNPFVIVLDEFHAFKVRGLLDVMESATGARDTFLNFQITTAGDDPVSPCGDQHDYACKILDGVLEEDASTQSFFAFIAHADVEDDWLDERTWAKANPHYDVSVNPDDMRKLAMKAKNMPSAAAEFKQKRLNIWVNSSQPWLSLDGWKAGQSSWDPDELLHQSCWVGVDLASSIDLCAMVFVFPPTATRKKTRLLRWIWTPKDTLKERARRDRAPYEVWAEQGHLVTPDGVRVNHKVIREVLVAQRDRYRIEQIGFDPWHADLVMDELTDRHVGGFSEEQVILVPQTYAGMSKAALDFEASVLECNVDANRCPVMTWCASNAVVQRDGKDNIYPVKKKSRGRIDPIMASIIGWRLASLGVETQRRKKRGPAKTWTPQGWKEAGADAQPTA